MTSPLLGLDHSYFAITSLPLRIHHSGSNKTTIPRRLYDGPTTLALPGHFYQGVYTTTFLPQGLYSVCTPSLSLSRQFYHVSTVTCLYHAAFSIRRLTHCSYYCFSTASLPPCLYNNNTSTVAILPLDLDKNFSTTTSLLPPVCFFIGVSTTISSPP